jgi:uncharacterized membrane protein
MPRATRAAGGDGIGEMLARLLVDELQNLARAFGERAVSTATERVGGLTERLAEYAAQGGNPQQVAAAAGARKLVAGKSSVKALLSAGVAGGKETLKLAVGRRGRGKTDSVKATNIVEFIDVGVPVRVAYNQWTQYEDFPRFMKKVENVERESDEKLTWKTRIFWSHRTWQSTTIHQVPDERIVWRAKGEKGSVDGAVSFHALTPTLTRIVLVLEYHPQGLFERTGNIWRAPGRRARLELKHFVRHVMTQTVLHPDEVEGWRGEIRAGQVVQDHESARAQEDDPDLPDSEREQAAPRPRRPRAEPDEPRRRPARRAEGDEPIRRTEGDQPARRPARATRPEKTVRSEA